MTDPKEETFEKWRQEQFETSCDNCYEGDRETARIVYDSARADLEAKIKRLEEENARRLSDLIHVAMILGTSTDGKTMGDQAASFISQVVRLRSELEKAVELLRMLLEAKDCLHNGQPEIVKELSVILDIGLHEANELVTFLQSQKGENHA